MRRAEHCQDLILVSIEYGKWVLGERLPDGKPPRLLMDQVFTRLEDGEWEAFCRRWRTLTGQSCRCRDYAKRRWLCGPPLCAFRATR